MAKRVIEHLFTGTTTPYTSYSSTKTNLGDLIEQYTGSNPTDKFAGPLKIGVARPSETSTAVPGIYPHVVRWCNKSGTYSTGTVSVSGTAVTGSGTSWLADGVPIGARIGFGTTDPDSVTTWYTISAIASGTSITLENTAGTISGGTSFVINKDVQIDWVFLADNAAAAATRRTTLFTYNRNTSLFAWQGFITNTFPTTGNVTTRGMRVLYDTYTTGTVSASASATITGSGTTWSADRIFLGARIGFGSTDPTQISTWYYVNAVGSDTSITVQSNVTASGTGGTAPSLTLGAGTAYVIEDLRILHAQTNATAANGGLFLTGCVSFNDFTVGGITIAAAATTDKVKAVYWLSDAATTTMTNVSGVAIDSRDSWTQQYAYCIDLTLTFCFKYNVRAAFGAPSSGKVNTAAFVFKTGAQAFTGTLSQTNNGRIGTLNHGPASGVKSLYFVTTTRVGRAAVSGITSGSTTWITDYMTEVPTGGTSTFTASSIMTQMEVADQIDRLIITTTGAGTVPAHNRAYITQYKTDGSQFDHIFLADTRQQDQGSADSNSVPHLSQQGAALSIWSEGGLAYFARTGTASTTNLVYAVPLSADWAYAAGIVTGGNVNQRLITPALSTSGAVKLVRVYSNDAKYLGDGNLTIPTEPYRVYYRTSGITDDSGSWTLVDQTGDLSSAVAGDNVQFAIEFRVAGTHCLPDRLYNICCVYEDNTTDSHYQPSAGQSSLASKRFAWRFSTAFGGTVPSLTIRLYDAVTGGLLLTDTTVAQANGTFEKSTDGGTNWSAYNTTDKANDTTYIRYTPTSLGDNIRVRALLTQS